MSFVLFQKILGIHITLSSESSSIILPFHLLSCVRNNFPEGLTENISATFGPQDSVFGEMERDPFPILVTHEGGRGPKQTS